MSSSESATPQFGRLVTSAKEFWKLAKGIVHVAFKRISGFYFHHCIITSFFDTECNVYEYFLTFVNFLTGPGEVGKNDINKANIEESIKSKEMYVIEAPYYPKTEQELKEASKRFWDRSGEQLYSLACNNCEHLVNYILTGTPYSEQIQKAGAWKMAFVDASDTLISRGKRLMLKMASCQIAAIPARYFAEKALEEVVRVSANVVLTHMPLPLPSPTELGKIGKCAKNFCNAASKSSPNITKCQLLASKECVQAAEVASKQALKRTAVSTFVILSAVVESGFAAYDIYQLEKQREHGHITQRDFNRETTKAIGGAACATGGSVIGGVIGQAFIPHPGLGFAVGSAIGNGVSRTIGNAISGFIFDECEG